MNIITRMIVYSTIIILVFGALYLTRSSQAIEPKGLFLPAKANTSLPAISVDAVKIYQQLPPNNQVLGTINLMQAVASDATQASFQKILQDAKQLSAQYGTNGLYITILGETPASETGKTYVLRAKAFKE